MRRRLLGSLAALLLAAVPALAADRVIQNGIDPWRTPGDGKTFIDFATSPIPAGFFCAKSAPFSGKIVFRGVPVATGQPGSLGKTDTIVQRLDDATFNDRNVAVTRIQIRALHFESVNAVETACGTFKAEVKLSGNQPITKMRIVREDESGGRFFAPISVNGKVVFTRLDGRSNEVLEIARNVRFPADQGIVWASSDTSHSKRLIRKPGFVLVDTDQDGIPDTNLPGTSTGFAAGANGGVRSKLLADTTAPEDPFGNCHLAYSYEAIAEGHCPVPY